MQTWFLLSLLAPLLFAIVNLIDDNLIRNIYRSAYFGATISGLFGALPLISLLFLKLETLNSIVVFTGLLAGFITVLYYYFYFKALTLDSPSVVIAIYSLAPALIPIFAYLFLDERLNILQFSGFLIVLFSTFALSLVDVKKLKVSAAFLPMLVATILFALSTMLQKFVYNNTNFYSGFMFFSLGMGLGGYFFLVIMKLLKSENFFIDFKNNSKKIISFLILAELIAIIAGWVLNLAIEKGNVSLVVVISGVQPIYVLLIALLFYRFSPKHFREATEGGLLKKLILMSVIIMGLLLIY